MVDSDRPWSSRVAAILVAVGLSLTVCGVAFHLWMLRVQEIPPIPHPPLDRTGQAMEKVRGMSTTLWVTFSLASAFIVGSFVMVRAGRFFLDRAPMLPRTQYVDAWGRYRVSDEDIAAVTGSGRDFDDDDDDGDDDTPLDDRPPRNPRTPRDDS